MDRREPRQILFFLFPRSGEHNLCVSWQSGFKRMSKLAAAVSLSAFRKLWFLSMPWSYSVEVPLGLFAEHVPAESPLPVAIVRGASTRS